LQKLPETITQQDLVELFQRFPGFREVRMIPTKKSIAFVEYDNELQSATARSELSDHVFDPEHIMKVTFARK
jgi:RNA recognition motif-containing protein